MKKLLITIILGITLFSLLRLKFDNKFNYDVNEAAFYIEKMRLFKNSTTLIFGDSRVLNGINPYYFGKNSLNFAFNSHSYTERFLKYVDRFKSNKALKFYFGISVQSLSDFNQDLSFYKEFRRKNSVTSIYVDYLFNRPIDIWNIQRSLKSYAARTFFRGYMSLGNEVLNTSTTKPYAENYKDNQFKPSYIENLVKYASKWKDKGIEVIFFLTPSPANIYDFDPLISGVSLPKLKNLFSTRGYQLHQFTSDTLKYVDGDHLTDDSSNIFSKWVASL